MRILDEMMHDTKASILLHYQKVHFIGGSGTGKSTTRNRLIRKIKNLASRSVEERKPRSTNLAEFTQVMAIMDESKSKLTFQVASDHDDETHMLFDYVNSNKSINTDSTPPVQVSPKLSDQNSVDGGNPNITSSISSIDIPNTTVAAETTAIPIGGIGDSSKVRVTVVDVDKVIDRLRSIVGSGKYTEQLQNKVLLNLIDVGGQPGFLEMLPFLSKGPGMFLAFFRLDKDLDEFCEVSFERDEDKITPYTAIYTIRETLSQILSAINHHVMYDQTIDKKHLSKLGDLASKKPVATLVGTFKDKLETKVTREALEAKLSTHFPKASESEKKEVINHVLTGSIKGHNPTAQVNTDMQSAVNRLLTDSESFQKEVRNRLDQKLAEKNETISTITCHFGSLLFPPEDDQQFISLDNFNGEEADIDPLREHLQGMFETFFKDAKLRIRPSQLLLGVILRKEYDIVSMDDCIRIGRALSMREEEVRFSVWYLDRWVGALIYHPEIEDEDDWFKKNIICSPQVVFDSISSLIVEPLLELHCPKGNSRRLRFLPDEKKNWAEKGQFSLDTVKRCLCVSEKIKKLMEEGKLIPVEKLVKFLEHSNLLSLITIKKQQGKQVKKEIMCFIPAILECASLEELTNSSPTDIDTPSPIKITFESGYVPVGVFCAMISQLISKGKKGVLGIRWELVESGVKRNLVSFRVDNAENIVTLVAHVDCYEIRVIKQGSCLHDFRLYVLSTVLFMIKEISGFCYPIIAFDCKCGHHQSKTSNRLCRLSTGMTTSIRCKNGPVTLQASQESWFAKEVKLGDSVSLSVFPYAEAGSTPGLTFKWIKNGPYKGDKAELRLENVGHDSCTGYYSCMILRNGEDYFNMYYCLSITSSRESSEYTDFHPSEKKGWSLDGEKNIWMLKKIHSKLQLNGEGIKIAVLDTGLFHRHKSFADKLAQIKWFNFVADPPGHGQPLPHDTAVTFPANHGTAIVSLALQVAPKATIYVMRVSTSHKSGWKPGHVTAALDALLGMDEQTRPDIVSMSFGFPNHDYGWEDKIDELEKRGTICVAAAGNGGAYQKEIPPPACFSKVISVGSLNIHGEISGFTPKSREIQVYAPGEGLQAPCLPGNYDSSEIVTTIVDPKSPTVLTKGNILIEKSATSCVSGTSMATPVIAGLLALLFQHADRLTSDRCRKVRKSTFARSVLTSHMQDTLGSQVLRPYEFFSKPTITRDFFL